ncbi:NADH-ubiquinone oxidoreductase 39-40 kDa subunit -like protein [Granulibacter bethesdensis]|nr:NADH-ubiquinone oxidoreductase 39-40 kDa subunit -like protein [Granulibacter bethesdensis]
MRSGGGLWPAIPRTSSIPLCGIMIPHTMNPGLVAVIGATGRTGLALCRALSDAGMPFRPVVRNPDKWLSCGITQPAHAENDVQVRGADVTRPDQLRHALDGVSAIVATSHASHSATIIEAAPEQASLILMGSTRKFSAFTDPHCAGVRAGEQAFLGSGRHGVMLHPTMIYGDPEEQTLRRLARLIRKTHLLPIPDGGRALIQPIYQDDVTRCLIAALSCPWKSASTLVIAGPEPVSYADCIRLIARISKVRAPLILPLPASLMLHGLALGQRIPALARRPFMSKLEGEIQRLTENRSFDITPMRHILGIEPISLKDGLTRSFNPAQA